MQLQLVTSCIFKCFNVDCKAGLTKLASRVSGDSSKNKSKKLVVRECLQYLTKCHEHVLDLTSACTLVDLMKALVHHASDDITLSADIASICHEMLKRQWYDLKGNREKGAVTNGQLTELLNGYFSKSEDQLASVTATCNWLSTECQELNDKDACLQTFPGFSKNNLHILVGGLLKGLEGGVKQALDRDVSDRDQLELWSSFTQCLESLVTIVKAHDSKPNLRVFMKGCTTVLRLFLSNGMPTCSAMFKHEPAVVSQILKKLQVTTRYIQTVCNFVKVSKDTGLTQFLPSIRAVMETILLRVKNIIVINNCADAFFMGSMKNRDLKGQEIPSQEIQLEEEDGESIQNEGDSESEKEDNNSNSNLSEDEENEETGESVSI